jgi:hypothetical protein
MCWPFWSLSSRRNAESAPELASNGRRFSFKFHLKGTDLILFCLRATPASTKPRAIIPSRLRFGCRLYLNQFFHVVFSFKRRDDYGELYRKLFGNVAHFGVLTHAKLYHSPGDHTCARTTVQRIRPWISNPECLVSVRVVTGLMTRCGVASIPRKK